MNGYSPSGSSERLDDSKLRKNLEPQKTLKIGTDLRNQLSCYQFQYGLLTPNRTGDVLFFSLLRAFNEEISHVNPIM